MDPKPFVIQVCCPVCERFDRIVNGQQLRTGGFAPAPGDEETVTVEKCWVRPGFDKDEAIFDFSVACKRGWSPRLKERASFARQAANLRPVKSTV